MAELGFDREGFRPSYRPVRQAAAWDPDMKRMGIIAGGVGAALALIFGATSLLGHRHHGVPVIEAEAGPVRIKPVNAGGMQVTGADLGLSQGTAQTLAPVAEQPQLNELKAQLHAVKKELARQAAQTAQVAKLAEATSTRIAAAPPVQRASATARIPVPDEPAMSVAAALPVHVPAKITVKPVAVAPGPAVQLAAFTDEAAAHTGWELLVKKSPDLLGGRNPDITRAQAGGRTMWRLRTGGFGTVAEAATFCGKMRAHGADCSIAAF